MAAEQITTERQPSLGFLWSWALIGVPVLVWAGMAALLRVLVDAGISLESPLFSPSAVALGALASAAITASLARFEGASRRLRVALVGGSAGVAIVLPCAAFVALEFVLFWTTDWSTLNAMD